MEFSLCLFGGPEGYSSLAIIAFGAFGFSVPKYYYRLGQTDKSLDSGLLNLRRLRSSRKELAELSLQNLVRAKILETAWITEFGDWPFRIAATGGGVPVGTAFGARCAATTAIPTKSNLLRRAWYVWCCTACKQRSKADRRRPDAYTMLFKTFVWFPPILPITSEALESPQCWEAAGLGNWPNREKFPKVLRGGCKRSFGTREQRSPKSLLHHPNLLLHRCKMGLHRCKRLCAPWGSKRPFAPSPKALLGIFPVRPISQARSFPTPMSKEREQINKITFLEWNSYLQSKSQYSWGNSIAMGNLMLRAILGATPRIGEKPFQNNWDGPYSCLTTGKTFYRFLGILARTREGTSS